MNNRGFISFKMDKEQRIRQVISEAIDSPSTLKEGEDDKFSKMLSVLEEAQRAFSEVRTNLSLHVPHEYKQIFEADLKLVMKHADEGLKAIEAVANKVHQVLKK